LSGLTLSLACTSDPETDSAAPTSDTSSSDTSSSDTSSSDTSTDSGDSGEDTGDTPTSLVVDPSDEALRYIGRWNFDDPSEPWVDWQGASVALQFQGTALEVTLNPGNRTEYFRVIVDGDDQNSTHFAATSGVASYTLAEDLDPGVHTVELVKETYVGTSLVLHGFTATGTEILEAPPTASRHIEFYGDSNLAGYSLMSEQNQSGSDLQGSHFTYAGVTARAFAADYTNVSVSGETLQGMTSLYDTQDYYGTKGDWDFGNYDADLVVMNLGANDIWGASEGRIRDRYATMLDLLRAAHPDAHIVVFNSWGWDFDEPANYTGEVVEEYGDPNVSVAYFPWIFEQWHGAEYDHGGMARYLIAHLEDVLGWEATEPELMSGYGWDGGLANGSFEEVAPFGGYGWRYYTDTGVERVEESNETCAPDSEQAHAGDYFLRLSDGAEVHQPNPARDGQEITVSLWIRGAEDGDSADLTLDFRNQEMWTDPLQSETTTVDLTTEWTEYTVSATAPTESIRPVFHTRLTLEAGRNSTVDFDGLVMTTSPL
jgi:hypothetical protein